MVSSENNYHFMKIIKNSIIFSQFFLISKRVSIELTNQITAIISLPLIVNGLDFEIYGLFTFCLFFSYLMGSISGWGIHVHIIESLAAKKIDKNKINNYISVTIILKLIGLLVYILGIFIFSSFIFQTSDINQHDFLILLVLAFLIIFNPLELIQAFGQIEKIFIPSIIGRIIFLILLFFFKDNLSFSLLIYLFIIMMILPFILGNYFIWNKFNFTTLNQIPLVFGVLKKSKNTIFLFLENHYFFIILSFVLSFKLNLYDIAIFNFLIQLFRPGLALVEMSMRLTWQVIIKNTTIKQNFFSLFLALLLILTFLLTSIFGFSLFNFVISNQSLLVVWPEIKFILYILCIEVVYFYLVYIYLYQKHNFINQTEKIILPFLGLKFLLIPSVFFLELTILNIFMLYALIKIIQIILIFVKVKLTNKLV